MLRMSLKVTLLKIILVQRKFLLLMTLLLQNSIPFPVLTLNVKEYEERCSNLPEVPESPDPNEDIEARLLRLKFFNKTWINHNKTDQELSDEVTDRFERIQSVATSRSPKENTEVNVVKTAKPDVTEGVFSTREDTQEFNRWYYDQIAKSSGKRAALLVLLVKLLKIISTTNKLD